MAILDYSFYLSWLEMHCNALDKFLKGTCVKFASPEYA